MIDLTLSPRLANPHALGGARHDATFSGNSGHVPSVTGGPSVGADELVPDCNFGGQHLELRLDSEGRARLGTPDFRHTSLPTTTK